MPRAPRPLATGVAPAQLHRDRRDWRAGRQLRDAFHTWRRTAARSVIFSFPALAQVAIPLRPSARLGRFDWRGLAKPPGGLLAVKKRCRAGLSGAVGWVMAEAILAILVAAAGHRFGWPGGAWGYSCGGGPWSQVRPGL